MRQSHRKITLLTSKKSINIEPAQTRLPLGIVKRSEVSRGRCVLKFIRLAVITYLYSLLRHIRPMPQIAFRYFFSSFSLWVHDVYQHQLTGKIDLIT